MNPIFKKLNYKDQPEVFILQAPESFKKQIDEMSVDIKTTLSGAKKISFVLAFVTKQKEVDELTTKIVKLLENDGLLWFAYPKGTSKRYTCEFNRDNGWAVLGKAGFEPVRMVVVDEDWSALRFRKPEHIAKMTRSVALTEAGKKKIAAAKKGKSKK
jgi:hypothetical protein